MKHFEFTIAPGVTPEKIVEVCTLAGATPCWSGLTTIVVILPFNVAPAAEQAVRDLATVESRGELTPRYYYD